MIYSGYGGNSEYMDPDGYYIHSKADLYRLGKFRESRRLADYFLGRTVSIKWSGLAQGIHQVPNTYNLNNGYKRKSKCQSLRW